MQINDEVETKSSLVMLHAVEFVVDVFHLQVTISLHVDPILVRLHLTLDR